jgi:hypothetical protein
MEQDIDDDEPTCDESGMPFAELEEERALERIIVAAIARRDAAAPGSAQRRMAERQLWGLNSSQKAEGIFEGLEEWGYHGLRRSY